MQEKKMYGKKLYIFFIFEKKLKNNMQSKRIFTKVKHGKSPIFKKSIRINTEIINIYAIKM